MLKILLKKQFSSIAAALFRTGKRNKSGGYNMGKGGKIGICALFAYCAVAIVFLFYLMMDAFYEPFCVQIKELQWLYFAYGTIVAMLVCIIFSAFTVPAQMYEAKDNELLLSMPVKPLHIFICRLLPIYLLNLILTVLILLPGYVRFGMGQKITAVNIVGFIVNIIAVPITGTMLSLIIGGLVAFLTSRSKRKNVSQTIMLILFFALYIFLYSKMQNIMAWIIENSLSFSTKIKTYLFFFYSSGNANLGSVKDGIIVIAFTAVLSVLVIAILLKNYVKIMTTKIGFKSKNYVGNKAKVNSCFKAVFKRDLGFFVNLPIYLFNCGIGSLVLLAGAVIVVINKKELPVLVSSMGSNGIILASAIIAAAVMFIISMDEVTAPSISIEGKNIWINKSLPIAEKQILLSKVLLCIVVTAPMAVVFIITASVVCKLPIYNALCIILVTVLFSVFVSLFGLKTNLKHYSLSWDHPTVPVKQSISVLISMLIGWAVIITSAGIYYLIFNYCKCISINVFMLFVSAVLLVADYLLYKWVINKGTVAYRNIEC